MRTDVARVRVVQGAAVAQVGRRPRGPARTPRRSRRPPLADHAAGGAPEVRGPGAHAQARVGRREGHGAGPPRLGLHPPARRTPDARVTPEPGEDPPGGADGEAVPVAADGRGRRTPARAAAGRDPALPAHTLVIPVARRPTPLVPLGRPLHPSTPEVTVGCG